MPSRKKSKKVSQKKNHVSGWYDRGFALVNVEGRQRLHEDGGGLRADAKRDKLGVAGKTLELTMAAVNLCHADHGRVI